MKRTLHFFILACMVLALGLSCSDSESRVPAYLKTAKVIINLGLPEAHATASQSIIDRVLRFFARDAVAQTAPASFSSIFVRVTGPDMGPIEKTFSPGASISFEVPAGAVRQFEVIAYVAPGDPSAAVSFRGTGAASLPAGSTVSIIVAMSLYETKLVIPEYYNNRLYIIDSLVDTIPVTIYANTLAEKNSPEFSSWYTFMDIQPYDIDYDSLGRIYMSNDPDVEYACIMRMNTVNGDGVVPIVELSGMGQIYGIAIDRKRNLLYYGTDSNGIWSVDLSLKTERQLPLPIAYSGLSMIRGIAIDEEGNCLYLTGSYGGFYGVLKFKADEPENTDITRWTQLTSLEPTDETFDVLIKKPFVYVSQYSTSGGTNNNILQLAAADLTYTGTIMEGLISVEPPIFFFGPTRFVAKMNRGIRVMDQAPSLIDNRIVFFLDMDGTGWYPYTPPALLSPFIFYYMP
ncbi:MAG: hypothetical protein JW807_17065 [Spirochaetes bacterium]|nr:hypothetical protein [Spirochaetota bacterium]